MQPLAEQIRPSCLEEIVGQQHLLAPNRPLRRIIESGKIPNMIFYGPSGVGKTTVARIIANSTSMSLHKLNGTTASTADLREVAAEVGTLSGMHGILLYLDEIQYKTTAKPAGIHRKRTNYPDCLYNGKSILCRL